MIGKFGFIKVQQAIGQSRSGNAMITPRYSILLAQQGHYKETLT
jgi:hypothetical protein